MAIMQFDMFRFMRTLSAAGIPEKQAKAQAEAMSEAFGSYSDGVVTREYLDARLDARFTEQDARFEKRFSEQDANIEKRFAKSELLFADFRGEMRGDMKVLRWMMATVVATTVVPALSRALNWLAAL